MSDFKPGDLVWWWDTMSGRAGGPVSGVVLEVQAAFSSPILAPTVNEVHYDVLTGGRRRRLACSRLKRTREDCKWPALITDDIVSAQPMTAPVSEGLFEWKRMGEGDE